MSILLSLIFSVSVVKADPIVTCVLQHVDYRGDCLVDQDLADERTAEQACDEVLSCQNNYLCSKNYCNNTDIHQNWILKEIINK